MAHTRDRFIRESFKKIVGYSPIVGILGHRQVGKTTFLESEVNNYLTFDDFSTVDLARKDPKSFLQGQKNKMTAIDECQYVESLFPALKEAVRLNKKPGQFVLSGSVRFTSKKSIRESLTGRVIYLELLPLTVSELRNESLPNTAINLLNFRSSEKYCASIQKYLPGVLKLRPYVEQYLVNGGLPGVCFTREVSLRDSKIKDQLSTIIDRDLRMIYETKLPYLQIIDYLRLLAANEGQPLNYSKLARATRISEEVQKNLLFALEAVFVIRLMPVEGRRTNSLVYFEDQAEMGFLAGSSITEEQKYEGLLYRNIRAQFSYTLGHNVRYFQYLTRGKARVPLAIQSNNGRFGMILIQDKSPNKSEKQMAASFLKTYSDSMLVFISPQVKSTEVIDDRSFVAPIELFV